MNDKSHQHALPENHQLHWYSIRSVLGQGAFGITYLAHDINLDRLVAIKEYMPGQMAARMADLAIQPLSDEHREDFHWGLTRFVDEARTLTRFEHSNLVRVLNVFELHGTAYMVMNYELGESLQQILKRRKTLDERSLIAILVPLMNGLELIHGKGFVHRDIKPANIFIRNDGSPVLLDFGSARQTRGHDDPQTLTTLVSPGYAPIEQYTSRSDRQGPWTDIYGLAATLYRAIVGSPPSPATDRSALLLEGMQDDLQSLHALAADRYSEGFLAAIDHGLAFKVESRPQSIAAWRREFAFDEADIATDPDADRPQLETAITQAVPGTLQTGKFDREAKTEPVGPPVIVMQVAEPAPAQSRNKITLLPGVAAVLVFGIGLLVVSRDEANGGSPATVASVPVPMVEPVVTAEESPTPVVEDGESPRIAELLALAESDVAALRLMSPRGNNAYERYHEVLVLDAGNAAAVDGLRALSQRYVDLAHGAMAREQLDDAAIYLMRAGRIEPSAETLTDAKATLARTLRTARRAAEAEKKTDSSVSQPATVRPAARRRPGVPVEERHSPSDGVKRVPGEN